LNRRCRPRRPMEEISPFLHRTAASKQGRQSAALPL
jgi:hypothetical protein